MYDLLSGLTIIEGSAFVAAPLGGMTLAQLGANVIRFDPIGGGMDFKRWPLDERGNSLYWSGLNKGKKSAKAEVTHQFHDQHEMDDLLDFAFDFSEDELTASLFSDLSNLDS